MKHWTMDNAPEPADPDPSVPPLTARDMVAQLLKSQMDTFATWVDTWENVLPDDRLPDAVYATVVLGDMQVDLVIKARPIVED